jgi:hypothetical protein
MTRGSLLACMVAAALAASQPWLMLVIGIADTSSLASLAEDTALARRMFTVLCVLMPPMFVAYWLATRACVQIMPATASFALYAFGLWFALELLPRSFDLFVVLDRWLPRFMGAAAEQRERLEEQYAAYRDALSALVFVRRNALMIAQACLAACMWSQGLVGKLLAGALGLGVLRLLLGTLAQYGGMGSLSAIDGPLYLVTAGSIYPLLAIWAYRRSRDMIRPTTPAAEST